MIGRRLTNSLAYTGRTETTVLLEEPETLDAELLQEEENARIIYLSPGHPVMSHSR